jgi:hypothetical protein
MADIVRAIHNMEPIQWDSNVNEYIGDYTTPLITAVESQMVDEYIIPLLKAGANPNQRSKNGKTSPLYAADDTDTVKILLDAGADPNQEVNNKYVILQAVETKNIEVVKILLKAGADPNVMSDTSPLRIALYNQSPELVKILLEAGADPNKQINGKYPIENAVALGNEAIIELLLKAGAKDPGTLTESDKSLLFSKYNFKIKRDYSRRDLQRTTQYYSYNGNCISVTRFPWNSLKIETNEGSFDFEFTINRLIVKKNVINFILCMAITLLLHTGDIRLTTQVEYNGISQSVETLSVLCTPFNQIDAILERESDTCKLKHFKMKKLLSQPKKSETVFENIQITVYRKYKTNGEVFHNNTIVDPNTVSFGITVPKIYHSSDYYSKFIDSQNKYILSLPFEDQLTVAGYTYNGDAYINAYIEGTFDFEKFSTKLDISLWSGSIIFPFIAQYWKRTHPYQRLTIETYNSIVFPTDESLWGSVMDLFIHDLRRIISNAPPLEFNMLVYRGIKSKYISKDMYFKNTRFSSASIDFTKAQNFTDKKSTNECCMLQVFVPKHTRILYIDAVSHYPEHEVLINIGSQYLVKDNISLLNIQTTNVVVVN